MAPRAVADSAQSTHMVNQGRTGHRACPVPSKPEIQGEPRAATSRRDPQCPHHGRVCTAPRLYKEKDPHPHFLHSHLQAATASFQSLECIAPVTGPLHMLPRLHDDARSHQEPKAASPGTNTLLIGSPSQTPPLARAPSTCTPPRSSADHTASSTATGVASAKLAFPSRLHVPQGQRLCLPGLTSTNRAPSSFSDVR